MRLCSSRLRSVVHVWTRRWRQPSVVVSGSSLPLTTTRSLSAIAMVVDQDNARRGRVTRRSLTNPSDDDRCFDSVPSFCGGQPCPLRPLPIPVSRSTLSCRSDEVSAADSLGRGLLCPLGHWGLGAGRGGGLAPSPVLLDLGLGDVLGDATYVSPASSLVHPSNPPEVLRFSKILFWTGPVTCGEDRKA
jgi:hypothetical protein